MQSTLAEPNPEGKYLLPVDGGFWLVDSHDDFYSDDSEPAPRELKSQPAPAPRAMPRGRTSHRQRSQRRAAKATASSDGDGEPDPALRPFIEAMADLVIYNLLRRESH